MACQGVTVRAGRPALPTPLGLIGSIAPLLGLLGTVLGMVGAFETIGHSAGADYEELAGNISLALVTTLLGLILAIPCIALFTFFRNRIDELVEDGYQHLKDHPTANRLNLVANELSVDGDTTFLKWREALAEFLDERGLGLIEDERPLDKGYSITILTSLSAIAGPLTLGFVKDSAFSEFSLDEVKTDNV